MPYSDFSGKDITARWISQRTDIQTIVDVGPGSGLYPKLLGKRFYYKAIEIWAPYIEEFNLHELYQEIIIGDVRYTMFPPGDVIIFGDVLEHLPKEDARRVIDRAEANYPHIIVSIPVGIMFQGASVGNKYENHLSYWSRDELMEIFKDYEIREIVGEIGIFIK